MSKIPDVEGFTELFKVLEQLMARTGTLLATPEGIVVFGVILVAAIRYSGAFRFVEMFGRHSRARAKALEKYLTNPGESDPGCVAVVRELKDIEHFQLATKIYAEKLRRTALINLHSRVEHKVTWIGIRRALRYFDYSPSGTASVRPLTMFEKIGYRFNQAFAALGLLFVVVLISILLLTTVTSLQAGVLTALIFLTIAACVFSLFQNLPEYFAELIAATLAEQLPESSSAENAGAESVGGATP